MGHKSNGEPRDDILKRIVQGVESPDATVADISLVASAAVLTREALKKAGYPPEEIHGELVGAACEFAGHILIAEFRQAGVILNDNSALDMASQLAAHREVKERIAGPAE